jgi:hypothetical protein
MPKLLLLFLALAPLLFVSAKADARKNLSEITITKKADKASPALATSKKTGTKSTGTTNKSRVDPYKNFKFR